jgi:HK97 family phage prohead protease
MTGRLELKAVVAVDEAGVITGTAWPFGSPDRMGDEIMPGAFKGARPPLPMLAFHDPAAPVGSWTEIAETAKGLTVKGRLLIDDVPRARELRALVQAGAVSGLSIGFTTKKAETRKGGGRTIRAVDLLEISLVTVPAHPGAKVTSAKSAADAIRIAEAINRAAVALRRSL